MQACSPISGLLALVCFGFTGGLLMCLFGLMLQPHTPLYFEWNVSNVEQARWQLFKAAIEHWLVFVAAGIAYLYLYPSNKLATNPIRKQPNQPYDPIDTQQQIRSYHE